MTSTPPDPPTDLDVPVHPAGAGVSDEEMLDDAAEQTDSASENADEAGKDWDGDPQGPAPV